VSIPSSSLDSKDTTTDVKERNIESSSSQIENQNILLCLALAIKTVSDSSSSRFVYNAENIETRNSSSILGGKTLRIIEVGGNTLNAVRFITAI
jgi:hypothetical protein